MIPAHARIGIVATSGPYQAPRLDAGLDWLRAQGFEPVRFDLDLTPTAFLAGTDAQRLSSLQRAMSDPTLDAVWAVRGGYGLTRILPDVRFEDIRPLPLIGFSDLTPLLNTLHARGYLAIHGPVLHSLVQTDARWLDHLKNLLLGTPLAPLQAEVLVPGTATGPLVGGNLAMLAATCGTPFQASTQGAILVLEEVHEPAYRIDRMLTQLRQSGVLDGAVGLALGTFEDCGDTDLLTRTLAENLAPLGLPTLLGLPIGHGRDNAAWRLGQMAKIQGSKLYFDPMTT